MSKTNNLNQRGGDNSNNYQALGDITINNGISQEQLEQLFESYKNESCSDVLINHYLCEDFSNLYEISSRDYHRFPLTNVRFASNSITTTLSSIIRSYKGSERDTVIDSNYYDSVEDYTKKHPNAINPRNNSSEFKYYEVMRDLEIIELEQLASKDGLLQTMLEHNLHSRCRVALAVGYEHGCWGIPLLEEFLVRRLWGRFTAITNTTGSPIVITSFECKYLSSSSFECYESSGENRKINLPPVPLAENATLVIPTALILPPIGPLSRKTFSSHSGESGERIQILQHDSIRIDEKDTYTFGDVINIKAITYRKGSSSIETSVQEFNFNNLFTYDLHWQIGSCPHIFTVGEDLKYAGEVLSHCQNKEGSDSYTVPSNVSEIILCELEDEVTELRSIYINKNLYASNVTLKKGDSLRVSVKEGDTIHLTGKYLPIGKPSTNKSASMVRAEIINDFIAGQSA